MQYLETKCNILAEETDYLTALFYKTSGLDSRDPKL